MPITDSVLYLSLCEIGRTIAFLKTIFAPKKEKQMTLSEQIKLATEKALQNLYPEASVRKEMITVNQTKPEFEGNYTLVLFPFLKLLKQKPDIIGNQIGNYL